MASFPLPNLITNLAAGSDLSSSQYKAVALATDGAVDVVTVAGSASIGFLQNLPLTGAVAEIATVGGGAKAIAGGTITAGDRLAVDAIGDVVLATPLDAVVGIALESAVDNDVFGILVFQPAAAVTGLEELLATAAVTAGVEAIELNHISVVIAATIADLANHQGLFAVKNTSASGTAAHTVTLSAGTWDGSNQVITLDAGNEAIIFYVDSVGNGSILANIGTVVLS